MAKRGAVLGSLVSALATACLSQRTDRPVIWSEPASLAARDDVVQAATALEAILATRNTYPQIERKCFGFELENFRDGTYDFAVRFNQTLCGGTSASNLLDRYRITLATKTVWFFDPTAENGQWFKPLNAGVRRPEP